ncbi:LRR receptor-like serine threonine-protein kinase [Seminavis robusta]|uniref:LRR receptor-like serine threonine-protein kinase n=1 Tax=Seminavis robusta TaxID=568900 RepID=A0A9N8HUV3_9STRA|nr:LRR receptor-like serine threonine-protein kinase [Seminavis robusta]|eukprot:Sro1816_g299480.1 LRR receptor-like serine threonine-protein kinase (630) ;mRNA; f:16973-19692
MEVNHETNASSHVDEDADAVEAVMKDRSLLEAKQRAYDEHHQHQNQIIEAEASDASDAESFLEDLLAFNQGTTDDKASATDKANGEKMVGNAYQKTAVIPLPGAVSVASGKEGWGGDGGKNLPNITKKETDKSNNESSGGALTRNGAQEATAETTPKPPAPEELQRRPNVVANSRPGAYSYTPDQGLQRSSTLTVAMGAGPPEPPEEEIEAGHAGSGTDAVQAGTRSRDNFEPNNGEPNNNLVEATPVTEDDQLPAGNLGAARQVDLEEERHKAEARKQEQKKFFIGVALLVLLEIGLLSNSLKSIYLYENPLSGAFPSELGLLTSMTQMDITYTHISSTIPSELFLMTNMESLYLAHNYLVGTIPPEIGLMTKMAAFWINNNTLTGSIPSQFGMLTDMSSVGLHQNSLSGSLPSELGRLTNVNQMSLRQNRFSGLMPLALCPWDCQEKISPFPAEGFLGRETAVSSDDCNCTVGEAFPLPNATNEVTINVQFDGWPEETSFSFKELDGKQNWVPKLSVTGSTDDSWNLVSYKEKSLTSNTLFHFYISDIWADGICCGGGVSITNGTKPVELIGTAYEEYQGTIVWSAQGYDEFEASAEVYLWVDSNGHVAVVTEEEGKNLTATIAHGG